MRPITSSGSKLIRPGGNSVVFDFPWDPAAQQFKPIGTPVSYNGREAGRLYVLRDLSPQNPCALNDDLMFASGIVHHFVAGQLVSVSDGHTALTAPINGLTLVDGGPDPLLNTPRYTIRPVFTGGRISSINYANTAAGVSSPIVTTVGYSTTSGSSAITSLYEKLQWQYDRPLLLSGHQRRRGHHYQWHRRQPQRATPFASGSVTLKTTLPGVTGYSQDTYAFNTDGLLTSDTHRLSTATAAATTSWQYNPSRTRYANGQPQWGRYPRSLMPTSPGSNTPTPTAPTARPTPAGSRAISLPSRTASPATPPTARSSPTATTPPRLAATCPTPPSLSNCCAYS